MRFMFGSKNIFEKILMIFLIIIFSPVWILLLMLFFLVYLIYVPIFYISNYVKYKRSNYYKDFKKPYKRKIYESYEYMFYNYAARENLPIKYISTKELDYFIYNDIVYIFPDFNLLRYNDQIKQFEIKYRSHNKEEFCTLEEFFEKKKSMLLEEYNMPIKLLLATYYINEEFLDVSTLPESVYVISNYDKAFKEDNIDWDEIPKSTKMLYEMMLKNEKLGGRFEMISDDIIEWELDDVIYEVGLQCGDGYFGVNKKDSKKTSITHWHPSAFSIYTDVCLVGEKGNVLVVKDFLGGSGVLYMGAKEKCDIKEKKHRLSKVYFFESK